MMKVKKYGLDKLAGALVCAVVALSGFSDVFTWKDPASKYTWTCTDSSAAGSWHYTVTLEANEVELGCGQYRMDGGIPMAVSPAPSGKISIPEIVAGLTVVSLGTSALEDSAITGVELPKTLKYLGGWCLSCCKKLTSVSVPEGVVYVGQKAFDGDTALKSISLPQSVEVIDWHAFDECSQLTSLELPARLREIREGAFIDCKKLAAVSIRSAVTVIGAGAFDGCAALRTVYVDSGDAERIKGLLAASGFNTSKLTFVIGVVPATEPEPGFDEKHTLNGLVRDAAGGMAGLVQITTAKKSKKGEVKVGGFVMLADGKKQSLKAASGLVSEGRVVVTTTVGKLGSAHVTVTESDFTGNLGELTFASEALSEETGVLKGSLTLNCFDAKTGKFKTKKISLEGVTDGHAAEGLLSVKGEEPKAFAAEF